MPPELLEKVKEDTKEITAQQMDEDLDKEFLKDSFWKRLRSMWLIPKIEKTYCIRDVL